MVRYSPDNLQAAYECRYSWTAWPSIAPLPTLSPDDWSRLEKAWEQDGLRALEKRIEPDQIQILFSVKPTAAPVFITARAKGRLDHALRAAGIACQFSRKVALRAVGHNTAQTVTNYIDSQVDKKPFVDAAFADSIRRFTYTLSDPDRPIEVTRGRYWYHLHLVLVHAERYRIGSVNMLEQVHDGCLQIATRNGYALSAISVMPDHLHLGVVGVIDQSPETIAMEFMNGVTESLGMVLYRNSYYVGTSGAYDMDGIRRLFK